MERKRHLKQLIFISTAVPAMALLYFVKDARITGFFPACPFHQLTGMFCPGCGSQRAISSLLHLQIVAAIKFNVLLVAALPLLFYSAVVFVVNVFKQKQVVQSIFYSPLFVRIFLAVVVAFFVLRNIPDYPFNQLAPHR